MNKMKKIIAVLLTVIMSFGVVSVVAFAVDETTYEVTFADLPYAIADYRDDYVADYMGYEYGVDYWYVVTHSKDASFTTKDGEIHYVAAGTKTEIKGDPVSITVEAGSAIEFTVEVADYIEAQSVRVIAFATGTDENEIAELDPLSPNLTVNPGEPYENYYIAKSSVGTYGVYPDKDITICVSEYHLYNDCFLYNFPTSDYYTANRVIYRGADLSEASIKDPASYETVEWGNTKVVYENETLYFEVRLDLDSEYDLHYDTYEVYYLVDELGAIVGEISGAEKVYLEPIYRYIDNESNEQVDIYAIENVSKDVVIKVTNTVTYTISMLAELLSDFSLDTLGELDLSAIDMSPMLELLLRIVNLIVKMLNSFGLNVSLGDLLG